MGATIGIDLGTTYSAVAILNDLGKPEILTNREGERITPSVVLYQDGFSQVGAQAKRSAATMPDDVAQFVKRQMGNPKWRFVTSKGDEYSAEQVSAAILKRLAEDAAMHLGEEVTDAVITVPAYFDDARRMATKQAGAIAGLNVLRVINEPTAAAVAYGLDTPDVGLVLVYDLGGGTFDVTLMRVNDGEFDVIATDGDRNLGGYDWDNALMSHVNDEVKTQGGPDLLDDEQLSAELRDKAEIAKRTLTTMPQAKIFMTADGRTFDVTITREYFEELTRKLLDRTRMLMDAVMEEADTAYDALDRVLLVGGSTRMPMVRRTVEDVCGRSAETGINPDEVVALGAAVVARLAEADRDGGASRSGAGSATPPALPIKISDVTSQGLGVVALDDDRKEINAIIIPPNTKIPASKSRMFSTVEDRQTELQITITEGNDEDPEYVTSIHDEPMQVPPYPKGAPLRVDMSYDIDGMIHVLVYDETAKKLLGEIELERPNNLDNEQVNRMRVEMAETQVG